MWSVIIFSILQCFGFWILDFGFWILDFGFWGGCFLVFGFWFLDFGVAVFGFWISISVKRKRFQYSDVRHCGKHVLTQVRISLVILFRSHASLREFVRNPNAECKRCFTILNSKTIWFEFEWYHLDRSFLGYWINPELILMFYPISRAGFFSMTCFRARK